MLTKEMKKEIIDYIIPEGEFSKGLIESDSIVSDAYSEKDISADDIYDFLNELRKICHKSIE